MIYFSNSLKVILSISMYWAHFVFADKELEYSDMHVSVKDLKTGTFLENTDFDIINKRSFEAECIKKHESTSEESRFLLD